VVDDEETISEATTKRLKLDTQPNDAASKTTTVTASKGKIYITLYWLSVLLGFFEPC